MHKFINNWLSKNKNKILNFSEFLIVCPLEIDMRIINLNLKDTDLDFMYKKFKDLNDYLSYEVPGEVETITLTLWTEEDSGNILFECDLKNKKIIYPTKLIFSEIDEKELFKILNDQFNKCFEKDNWEASFGNRFVTFLSREKYDLINEQDKQSWENAKNKNLKVYYENFEKQPSYWNEIIAPYLNYILDQEFIKNNGPENIKKITDDRFNNIKFKSFICNATDNESRIDPKRKIEGMPDICVYIYHLVSVPENDSLDTFTGVNINQWLVDNIKYLNINNMMDVIRNISFNNIYFNFCLLTTDTLGYDYFLFSTYQTINETKNNDLIRSLTMKNQSSNIETRLDKKSFIKEFKESLPSTIEDPLATEKLTKIDLPSAFTQKCNLLVSILLNKISKNKINIDIKLMKPELILFNLCENRITFISLIQSIKANFDVLTEVPETHLINMADVYAFIHDQIINSE